VPVSVKVREIAAAIWAFEPSVTGVICRNVRYRVESDGTAPNRRS
jgi:hypothetical protein